MSLEIYIVSMYLQELLFYIFKAIISASSINNMNIVFSIGPLFFVVLLGTSVFTVSIINRFPLLSKLLIGSKK